MSDTLRVQVTFNRIVAPDEAYYEAKVRVGATAEVDDGLEAIMVEECWPVLTRELEWVRGHVQDRLELHKDYSRGDLIELFSRSLWEEEDLGYNVLERWILTRALSALITHCK